MDEENIFSEIARNGIISGDLLLKGIKIFGDKFEKAIKSVKNDSVIKKIAMPSRRIIWKVLGDSNDYIVFPNIYCQCLNFNMSMNEGNKVLCKHLIAQRIAEILHHYAEEQIGDSEIVGFLREAIKTQNEE